MRFKERVAVVTGAARGIGKAIAATLARQGADVALLDISADVLQTADEMSEAGLNAMALTVDISHPEAIETAVADVVKRFGTVDILINNAGVVRPAALEDVTPEDWRVTTQTNLMGTFFCVKHCVPLMKARGRGKIVNIGSRASLGKQDRTAYSACKAGIIGMTRTWALELAPFNITVNNVAPGPIATQLFTDANPAGSPKTEAIISGIPLKRMGQPEDVANAAAFLASTEADFITGQTIFVCGGLTVGTVYY